MTYSMPFKGQPFTFKGGPFKGQFGADFWKWSSYSELSQMIEVDDQFQFHFRRQMQNVVMG